MSTLKIIELSPLSECIVFCMNYTLIKLFFKRNCKELISNNLIANPQTYTSFAGYFLRTEPYLRNAVDVKKKLSPYINHRSRTKSRREIESFLSHGALPDISSIFIHN